MSLNDTIREMLARHSDFLKTARTNRQNAHRGVADDICAICARDFGEGRNPETCSDAEVRGWSEDARFIYQERLAIAADLGMDTSIGSEAETIARREARRAAAGVPADFPSPRDGDLIDAALAAFQPHTLECIKVEPRPAPEGSRPAGGAS